jgi:hypothetical protein
MHGLGYRQFFQITNINVNHFSSDHQRRARQPDQQAIIITEITEESKDSTILNFKLHFSFEI